jgi:mono/diheme cytochrome c family protein
MTLSIRPSIGIAAAVLLLTAGLVAQGATQPQETASQTTLDGVYTAAQATRGDGVFSNSCTSCHTAASFKGGSFLIWNDTPLSELYAYLVETMPEEAPGSLTPAQYADLVAYLLKLNDLPAGKDELKPGATALAKITIKFRDR